MTVKELMNAYRCERNARVIIDNGEAEPEVTDVEDIQWYIGNPCIFDSSFEDYINSEVVEFSVGTDGTFYIKAK
jgi:hypothetical protein